jgi:indole-3-glycerol phosphate synthase
VNIYLSQIWADKQLEVQAKRLQVPERELKARLSDAPPTRGFRAALQNTKNPVALIAEIKRASPSKGVIRPDFDPAQIAQTYMQAGADCISVLTDEKYFQGHLDYMQTIRQQVALPLLRKDFIVDPYQIYESRSAGADAILLIVAQLEDINLLCEWREMAESLSMDVLVEVHKEEELQTALESRAGLIGINNRDLQTFAIDFETTFRLRAGIPANITVVSESGIESAEQVQHLREAGIHAMLIGESLMREPDPAQKIRSLFQLAPHA